MKTSTLRGVLELVDANGNVLQEIDLGPLKDGSTAECQAKANAAVKGKKLVPNWTDGHVKVIEEIREDLDAMVFDTPEQIDRFRAITIKHACKMYATTGMRPNRHWTATKMLDAATSITGKTYKRGQHLQASKDIAAVLEANE